MFRYSYDPLSRAEFVVLAKEWRVEGAAEIIDAVADAVERFPEACRHRGVQEHEIARFEPDIRRRLTRLRNG